MSTTLEQEGNLWEIANAFRSWVTAELNELEDIQREALRGDYLFVIDDSPRFVVLVEGQGAWSAALELGDSVRPVFHLPPPQPLSEAALSALVFGEAWRARVKTDSVTLRRLLTGSLRASVSFVSGRVKIDGDLASFMRLVSHLKRKGIGPVVSENTATV